ncbi:MAG: hypothetical protein PHP59_05875 [Methanofollis sp.]|nr:hypothetical protein [Methanofollis sp.]MDD4254889.1 hypothetical protein [Methanofollis sp.]
MAGREKSVGKRTFEKMSCGPAGAAVHADQKVSGDLMMRTCVLLRVRTNAASRPRSDLLKIPLRAPITIRLAPSRDDAARIAAGISPPVRSSVRAVTAAAGFSAAKDSFWPSSTACAFSRSPDVKK